MYAIVCGAASDAIDLMQEDRVQDAINLWGRCFGERKICIWRINRPLIHRLLCPFSGDERTEELFYGE